MKVYAVKAESGQCTSLRGVFATRDTAIAHAMTLQRAAEGGPVRFVPEPSGYAYTHSIHAYTLDAVDDYEDVGYVTHVRGDE